MRVAVSTVRWSGQRLCPFSEAIGHAVRRSTTETARTTWSIVISPAGRASLYPPRTPAPARHQAGARELLQHFGEIVRRNLGFFRKHNCGDQHVWTQGQPRHDAECVLSSL